MSPNDISAALSGLFGQSVVLDGRIAMYLPSQQRDGLRILPVARKRWQERIVNALCGLFGGATIYSAVGAWHSAERLVQENVTVIQAYGNESDIRSALPQLLSLGADMLEGLNQDSIAVEVDGRLLLIDRPEDPSDDKPEDSSEDSPPVVPVPEDSPIIDLFPVIGG